MKWVNGLDNIISTYSSHIDREAERSKENFLLIINDLKRLAKHPDTADITKAMLCAGVHQITRAFGGFSHAPGDPLHRYTGFDTYDFAEYLWFIIFFISHEIMDDGYPLIAYYSLKSNFEEVLADKGDRYYLHDIHPHVPHVDISHIKAKPYIAYHEFLESPTGTKYEYASIDKVIEVINAYTSRDDNTIEALCALYEDLIKEE